VPKVQLLRGGERGVAAAVAARARAARYCILGVDLGVELSVGFDDQVMLLWCSVLTVDGCGKTMSGAFKAILYVVVHREK
jgi:hypothetical protein